MDYIDPEAQGRYRTYRQQQGVASGTVDLEIGFLSKVYHLALKWKKIPIEVMPGEFILEGNHNPRRCVTEDEYQAILEHAAPALYDFLVCAWETGMRVSEICNLTASKIHMDMTHISGQSLDYIHLGIFDTKNKSERNIPITPALKEVFERRLRGLSGRDYVFINTRGTPFTKQSITARMKVVCKRASVVYGDKALDDDGNRIGITMHSFRHTRVTKWVEAGFSDEIIRMASGHKSLESYRKYVHLDPSAVMRLVKSLDTQTGQKQDISNIHHG